MIQSRPWGCLKQENGYVEATRRMDKRLNTRKRYQELSARGIVSQANSPKVFFERPFRSVVGCSGNCVGVADAWQRFINKRLAQMFSTVITLRLFSVSHSMSLSKVIKRPSSSDLLFFTPIVSLSLTYAVVVKAAGRVLPLTYSLATASQHHHGYPR